MDSKNTRNSHSSDTGFSKGVFNNAKNYITKQTRGGVYRSFHTCSFTNFIFSYLFLILLSAPLIFSLFHHDFSIESIKIGENRNLASAPDFRTAKLSDLPRLWDQYFKDNTPFRQIFMPGYIFTYENLLKTFVSEFVTGKNGDLFPNRAAPVVNAALGVVPYSEQAKEQIRLTAAGETRVFSEQGHTLLPLSDP